MKVLYVDLLCPSGHIFYNNIQIKAIAKYHEIDFVFQEGYAKSLNLPQSSIVYEYKRYKQHSSTLVNAFLYRLYMDKFQNYVANLANEHRYDVIFISSFETFSFCIRIPYKNNVIAVCHNNVDYIQTSSVKKNLFIKASQKVHFVSLNNSTSKYFDKIGAKHYNGFHGTICMDVNREDSDIIFMPVNDCLDQNVLCYINSEEFSNFLDKKGLKLYIKKKFVKNEHPNIVALSNYIEQQEYEELMLSAKAVLLPYDSSCYMYRSSGLFYEALGLRCTIIAPKQPNFEDEMHEGDHGIYLYETPNDIPQIIDDIIDTGINVSYNNVYNKMNIDILTKIVY